MPQAKAGNLCLFTMFGLSNFLLVGLGGVLVFLGVYEMVKMKGFNIVDAGLAAGGFLTSLIALVAFCGRRSICTVTIYLVFIFVVFLGYIGLVICYFAGLACEKFGKDVCEEIEKTIGPYLRYTLIGACCLVVRKCIVYLRLVVCFYSWNGLQIIIV